MRKEARMRRRETEEINCVTLTVEIQDQTGRHVPKCDAQFRIHDGYKTGWWPLGPTGKANYHPIHTTKVTSYVDIRGPDFQTQYRLGSGIAEDMTVVFVLNPCTCDLS
jgi:hypothetical protein